MSDPPRTSASETGTNRSERLVRALLDPACYPHAVTRIELIETHISWVLLTGDITYKIKKPLALPFLDFSTLDKRLHFCNEELRLNRRLAPEIYLDVVPIGGTVDAPRVGGSPAIEYAVELRQFDSTATADRLLVRGALPRPALLRLAESLAAFQAALPPAAGAPIERLVLDNIVELEQALTAAGEIHALGDIRRWTETKRAELEGVLAERRERGRVREGHGDLHLENVVLIDGELVPFDALEFDAAMRRTDVIDEAGFLVMDMLAHDRPDAGFEFLSRWLETSGDYPGLRVLGFYMVYRALVRAKVRAIKAAQRHAQPSDAERVRPYLALAGALTKPRTPLVLIAHGLSGSGKTTVTGELVPRLPAVRIRSDLERKRLHGVAAGAHGDFGVGEGRYDAAASDATYAALLSFAAAAVAGGFDVIVDAAFPTARRRAPFAELAGRRGADFAILNVTAPEATLRRRVRQRAAARSDASEATEAVLDAQLRTFEPPTHAEGRVCDVDTSVDVDYEALAERLRAARTSATNAAT